MTKLAMVVLSSDALSAPPQREVSLHNQSSSVSVVLTRLIATLG